MPVFPFNPQQYKDQQNFEQLPPGWYPAIITESEIVETSKKDGFRLKLTFQITDGPGKGRKVVSGYNIANPNPQAVEIAMSELKTICSCVGKFNPIQQSEELHNLPLQIRLAAQKDSDYNEVKGYKDQFGNDPGKAGSGAPAQQQQMPQQGYAQPQAAPPPAYGAPASFGQPQPQYAQPAPQQPPAYQQPQAPQSAAPAWAPPAPQMAAPQQQMPPQGYQQPQQQQAPAWSPNNAAPAAPAWAPQR